MEREHLSRQRRGPYMNSHLWLDRLSAASEPPPERLRAASEPPPETQPLLPEDIEDSGDSYIKYEEVPEFHGPGKDKWLTGVDLDEKCNICLMRLSEPFEDDVYNCLELVEENLRAMPCHHIFHKDCIYKWLSESPTCPVCRWRPPELSEEKREE